MCRFLLSLIIFLNIFVRWSVGYTVLLKDVPVLVFSLKTYLPIPCFKMFSGIHFMLHKFPSFKTEY